MRPKAKYHVIYVHRDQYPVQVMCRFFEVSRSGYYSFVKQLGKPEADADLAKAIQKCQDSCDRTYGYRRVWRWLEMQGIHRNKKAEKRLGELNRIFMRLYEDRVNGTVSDERFASMSKSYEDEQVELKQEVESLAGEIAQQEQKADDVEQFIAQAHKYVRLKELTPYALHELVKAIYIEAPDDSSGKRRQNIHISYDFVGFIPIHELMQEEMA